MTTQCPRCKGTGSINPPVTLKVDFDVALEQARLIQELGKSIKWFVVRGAYRAIQPYSKRLKDELDKLVEMIKEEE